MVNLMSTQYERIILLNLTRTLIAILSLLAIWIDGGISSKILFSIATILWVFINKTIGIEIKILRKLT